jgi:hypothetical protein
LIRANLTVCGWVEPEECQPIRGRLELIRPRRPFYQAEADEELHSGWNLERELADDCSTLRWSHLDQGQPGLPPPPGEDSLSRLTGILHPLGLAERQDVTLRIDREGRHGRRSHQATSTPRDRNQVKREKGDTHPLERLHDVVHRRQTSR